MNSPERALEDRYVLFFDFLGASNAAKTWPRERIHAFVDLLTAVAGVQSAQNIDGSAQEDGSYKFTIVPEVTTFSDNVVVSYPNAHVEEPGIPLFESIWTDIVLKDAIRILRGVAERGLRVGLLIRGGISFGQLYHDGDVVFGEAMVDAYELEKTHAKNPRILVSQRIIAKLTNDLPERINALLRDQDGEWHLNYMVEMVRQSITPGDFGTAMQWKDVHIALIDREIAALRPFTDGRATKWLWFKHHFEAALTQFPAYFKS
jgi:hypothetical protein